MMVVPKIFHVLADAVRQGRVFVLLADDGYVWADEL